MMKCWSFWGRSGLTPSLDDGERGLVMGCGQSGDRPPCGMSRISWSQKYGMNYDDNVRVSGLAPRPRHRHRRHPGRAPQQNAASTASGRAGAAALTLSNSHSQQPAKIE